MLETVILGTGNVAQHLFDAFSENDQVSIKQVVGRNEKSLSYFKKKTKTGLDFQAIEDADIYVIAVNDDAISTVSAFIASKTAVTVHTSGSIPIGALTAKRRGVFYPLQTFTKGKPVDFKNIPICTNWRLQSPITYIKFHRNNENTFTCLLCSPIILPIIFLISLIRSALKIRFHLVF